MFNLLSRFLNRCRYLKVRIPGFVRMGVSSGTVDATIHF